MGAYHVKYIKMIMFNMNFIHLITQIIMHHNKYQCLYHPFLKVPSIARTSPPKNLGNLIV